MSLQAQQRFISSVQDYYQHISDDLRLDAPVFNKQGYLTIAQFIASEGTVEFLFGPPEYHVEINIECFANGSKWGLPELIKLTRVDNWFQSYQSQVEGQSGVEAEVEWLFRLLLEGLKEIDEFAWIRKN